MSQSWLEHDNRLKKEVQFKTFTLAMNFLNELAELAESRQHHPDFRLYQYNKLEIEVYTHTSNKVEDKDRELAEGIDEILSRY